jgi:PHD/YefM family antitoxin component YafN of YafNO toxin-antitoxin module
VILYATNELIPSSEIAKKFGSYLGQIKDHSVEKLAILKNNKVEAVLISKDEYERMAEALKTIEANEMLQSISLGLDDVKNDKVQPIEKLWDKL